MNHVLQRRGRARASHRFGAVIGAVLVALTLGACEGLLEVDAPGLVNSDDLRNPENAAFLVTGTIADFECALGAYIVNGGLLGNELRDATITSARFSLDRRDHTPRDGYGVNSCQGNPPGVYVPLSTARWTADNAIAQLEEWTDAQVPNRTRLIGQAAAYGGYALVLMGEGFRTSVIAENGPEVQPADAFAAAIERFNKAITSAQAAGDTETLNMARIGLARANLNLGNTTAARDAATAALASSAMFVKVATASGATGRRYNRIGDEFFGGRITVDPSYRDLMIGGVPDTRVNVIDTNTLGHDSATPVWLATKIGPARAAALRDVSIPIATWREARLIIAEADPAQAEAMINALRTHHGLPPFDATGMTNEQIRQAVIEERSRELFLEGHHLGDLRRYNLAFVPAVGEPYRQGGSYGDLRAFELPDVERNNNPNVN
jgi:starch-binding outer membrane protein, SusD/RagB family